LAGGFALLAVQAATAQTPVVDDAAHAAMPGKAVFDQRCAMCHLNPEATRSRPVAEIRTYSAERIREALTTGVMKSQGARLSGEEKDDVIAYLAADAGAAAPAASDPHAEH
jgi:mono/diheme cytochrome c family protein